MKKLMMLLVIVGMLVGVGGCATIRRYPHLEPVKLLYDPATETFYPEKGSEYEPGISREEALRRSMEYLRGD